MVAGTEYQCNINQAINDLGVVQTGIKMVYIESQQTCPRGLQYYLFSVLLFCLHTWNLYYASVQVTFNMC